MPHNITTEEDLISCGILAYRNRTGLFVKKFEEIHWKFYIIWSKNHIQFKEYSKEVVIVLPNGKSEDPRYCINFRFSKSIDGWVASYIRIQGHKHTLVYAISDDMYRWQVRGEFNVQATDSAIVATATSRSNYNLYLGGLFIKLAESKDLKQWTPQPHLLFTSRFNYFDDKKITLLGATSIKQGILVLYDASHGNEHTKMLQVGAVLFSRDDPKQILWRSTDPLWKALIHIHEGTQLLPLGMVHHEGQIIVYWASDQGAIISTSIAVPGEKESPLLPLSNHYLKRSSENPILEPDTESEWESDAVFNPAAVFDDGKIHLFYRAIGRNGISVLGYASSEDGINFSDRHGEPVYEPGRGYGLPPFDDSLPQEYNPSMYTSGGGWSGYEDPRAVKIGKRVYVIYLAFGGWNSMRLALTSISERDLNNKNWNWKEPQFISPPGEVHKNWVLFPEKINGKFAILHGISPHILIDYINDLEEFSDENTYIKSKGPQGGRKDYWDKKVRGIGPPPLKTKLGWLILYHANDTREPHKYKLGAMILDKNDPTKILYRTSHPILCPDMPYENDGKPGVVYASGAVIKDDTLFVYYGGGDKVVCVATSPLDTFLENVKGDKEFKINARQKVSI